MYLTLLVLVFFFFFNNTQKLLEDRRSRKTPGLLYDSMMFWRFSTVVRIYFFVCGKVLSLFLHVPNPAVNELLPPLTHTHTSMLNHVRLLLEPRGTARTDGAVAQTMKISLAQRGNTFLSVSPPGVETQNILREKSRLSRYLRCFVHR